MLYFAEKDLDRCKQCSICDEIVACSRSFSWKKLSREECIGCRACYLVCPNEAIRMKKRPKETETKIKVNGEQFSVPERITVKKALAGLGYKISKSLGEGDLFAPCKVGGCYSCSVEIN